MISLCKTALFSMLLFACAVTVIAADAPATGTVNAPKKSGTLTAQGDGSIGCFMTLGTITVTLEGTLRVPSSAKVELTGDQGTRSEVKNRTGRIIATQYKNFKGKAIITLNDTDKYNYVVVQGKGIDIIVTGIGQAVLTGGGKYTLTKEGNDTKAEGSWTSEKTPDGQPSKPAPIIIGDFTAPTIAK